MYLRTLNETTAIFSIRICIHECCCYRIVPIVECVTEETMFLPLLYLCSPYVLTDGRKIPYWRIGNRNNTRKLLAAHSNGSRVMWPNNCQCQWLYITIITFTHKGMHKYIAI